MIEVKLSNSKYAANFPVKVTMMKQFPYLILAPQYPACQNLF